MKKINILKNKSMEEILEKYNALNIKEGILPDELNKIIENGVVFDGQCLFLKSMVKSSSHSNQSDFNTLVEYEITIMFSIDLNNLYPTCRFYLNRFKEGTMYVDDLEKYELHGMLIVEILNN